MATGGIALVFFIRTLGLPRWLLLGWRLRGIYDLWTDEMLREYIRSFGTRLPHDQPCKIEPPEDFTPRTEVAGEHALSEQEIRDFYRAGYLPPIRICSEAEARALGARLLARRGEVSSIYDFPCDRDRHLEMPEMLELLAKPALTERLAQLLGPDLKVWRSQIFYKPPGNNPVGWHQASTYLFEEKFAVPTLKPPRLDELFQLTVWMPTNPATLKSGCMRFYTGSLCEDTRWMILGGEVGFHAVNYRPDYQVDDSRVVSVEVQPGEALIFAERTIHGSGPNLTSEDRMAFNFRVIAGDVRAYPSRRPFHHSGQMGQSYDMSRWREVVLRGQDRTGDPGAVSLAELRCGAQG